MKIKRNSLVVESKIVLNLNKIISWVICSSLSSKGVDEVHILFLGLSLCHPSLCLPSSMVRYSLLARMRSHTITIEFCRVASSSLLKQGVELVLLYSGPIVQKISVFPTKNVKSLIKAGYFYSIKAKLGRLVAAIQTLS